MLKQLLTITILAGSIMTPYMAQAAAPQAKIATKAVDAKITQGKVIHVGVNGMVCDFCAQSLKKTFGKQKSVDKVDISLEKKLITLTLKPDTALDDKVITKLVTDAGYAVETIHRM